ncbi:MAG: WG repeat-containing protein [Saprospiraceae bacterium]
MRQLIDFFMRLTITPHYLAFAFLLTMLMIAVADLPAQSLFPIKKDKKWGLINSDGRIVKQPVYDAIGEFKEFGFAIMQRDKRVGMLDNKGDEVVPPKYDDVKVLDTALVSVMENGEWKVMNMQGKIILQPGYERVEVLKAEQGGKSYLAFRLNEKWGIVDDQGHIISEPVYDEIVVLQNVPKEVCELFFQTKKENLLGLLLPTGQELLRPSVDEIWVYNTNLFFYKKDLKWGAIDRMGSMVLEPIYSHFSRVSSKFIKLVSNNVPSLFSLVYNKLVTNQPFEAFYPFSDEYVLCKKSRKLGLVDHCGSLVLFPNYDEIQAYDGDIFRANVNGNWGIVTLDDLVLIPFRYDYISPMKEGLCVVIKNRKLGIANHRGEVVVHPDYDKVLLEGDQAKAYQGPKLTVFNFDKERKLEGENMYGNHFTIKVIRENDSQPLLWGDANSPYQLEKFEWFYSPKQDKWGLRRLDNGSVQIEPTFHEVQVEKELGLTLVGIETKQEVMLGKTSYRYEMAYGLVQNDTGLLVHEVDLFDVRLSDFDQELPVARCIFTNGKQGLVNRIGKIIRKDLAFVGDFEDGVARVSLKGRTSSALKNSPYTLGKLNEYFAKQLPPIILTDYTQYDYNIDRFGYLTCDDCEWGYLDTLGELVVAPQYSFARDFKNKVGIVSNGSKWGMVNSKGKTLLPCQFDELAFIDKTGNQVLRIFKKEEKYGLIDTLGRLAVGVQYEEIGSFADGRLAVKRQGRWGFVDPNGREVVPCRFDEVGSFSEGWVAVRLGSKWGYVDKNGDEELPFQYSKAGNFQNGLAPAKKEGPRFGYIDKTGAWAIAPQFLRAEDFDRGAARIVEMQGESYRHGLIDCRGNYIVRPKYNSIAPFDQHGLAIVSLGGTPERFSIINLSGQNITNQSFRGISPFAEGLARVRKKDGYGFINLKGQMVVAPNFSKASDFCEDRAAVWENGRCGFIDKSGNYVVQPEFSRCMDFKEGKAIVFKGNQRAGLIDKDGNFLIEPGINRLLDFAEGRGLVQDEEYKFYYITEQARFYDGYYEKASEFQHGVAVVQVDGRWAIINQQGIEIIPPKYDKISQFENGFAKVRIKGFNGLSNTEGEMIVQPDYEYISYAGEGLFRVEQGDKVGYFDIEGKWVWGLQE